MSRQEIMQDVSQEESTMKRPQTQQNTAGRPRMAPKAHHVRVYSNQDALSNKDTEANLNARHGGFFFNGQDGDEVLQDEVNSKAIDSDESNNFHQQKLGFR